ncbi:MAG: hypothetical protein ACRYFA_09430 [Janthinobacterium lividum]
MIPKEIFERRHFGTPASIKLIWTNFIVIILNTYAFVMCTQVKWYFWLVLGALAIYNFYFIQKNRDTFDRKNLIVYGISLILLLVVFFLLRTQARPC